MGYHNIITNGDSIIDSRDLLHHVIKLLDRATELFEEYIDNRVEHARNAAEAEDESYLFDESEYRDQFDIDNWIEESEDSEVEEYKEAQALLDDVESCSGEPARYGAVLIHADHWEDYCRELADDIGAIDRNAHWPLNHIDWEAAADELKSDYSTIEWDGNTYYVRN